MVKRGGSGTKQRPKTFFRRLQSESTLIRITHSACPLLNLMAMLLSGYRHLGSKHLSNLIPRSSLNHQRNVNTIQVRPLYTIEIVPWNHVWTTFFIWTFPVQKRIAYHPARLSNQENSP